MTFNAHLENSAYNSGSFLIDDPVIFILWIFLVAIDGVGGGVPAGGALDLVSSKKYDELADYILQRIKNLENGGADIIALTAATMHEVFDKLEPQVNKPFISIPQAAAEYAFSKGYKKVGLLGTIFTMEKEYLSKVFTNAGIEVFVPAKEDRELVHNRIAKELEYGIVKEESRAELISVIKKMQQENGIEAIILGCTELPLALNKENCPVDCLDIMEIHIQKLVDLAGEL